MTNNGENPRNLVDEPVVAPSAQAAEEAETKSLPRSIMLIASTESEIVNSCIELFFNHVGGECTYESPGHVGDLYDPKKEIFCALMSTEQPYSDEFLFSMLLTMKGEIGDPGIVDRHFSEPDHDD